MNKQIWIFQSFVKKKNSVQNPQLRKVCFRTIDKSEIANIYSDRFDDELHPEHNKKACVLTPVLRVLPKF